MGGKRALRRSLEEWMGLVTECKQSDLTDVAQCNEHGMFPTVFAMRLHARLRKRACKIPDLAPKAQYIILHPAETARFGHEKKETLGLGFPLLFRKRQIVRTSTMAAKCVTIDYISIMGIKS